MNLEVGLALVFASAIAAPSTQLPAECKLPANSEQAAHDHPTAKTYGEIGAWFAQQGDLKCALSSFEAAVQIEPHSAQAHYNLGVARIRSQALPAAAAEFRLALQYKPGMTVAHNALGSVLMTMGKAVEAEAEFREALKMDPNSVIALDQLAQRLVSERRYETAARYWKRALTLQPDSPAMRLSMGVATYQRGDPNESIRILAELVKAYPDMKSAHLSLADVYLHESLFREAAHEYAEAVRVDSADDLALLGQVKALVGASAFQAALAPAQEYVRRKPSDPEGRSLLASVQRGLGDGDVARSREISNRSEKSKSQDAARQQLAEQNLRASELLTAGHPAQAASMYRQMLTVEPRNARTEYNLALALKAEQDPSSSICRPSRAPASPPSIRRAELRWETSTTTDPKRLWL
jgi:tetratricopeptide (TPR) repeat protein